MNGKLTTLFAKILSICEIIPINLMLRLRSASGWYKTNRLLPSTQLPERSRRARSQRTLDKHYCINSSIQLSGKPCDCDAALGASTGIGVGSGGCAGAQ